MKDALDLVEFANGPVESRWGGLRAEMGHPAPFHLKILGVGNEQWGGTYFERYVVFEKALKERHPDLRIVSTSGPGVDDGNWNFAWGKFRGGVHADIVDEHYYRPPAWFLQNEARYDRQDRSGPRVFAGEFAAHRRDRKSALDAAIHEAAFMTGLLRNADLVVMSSYAPLFAREGFTQWRPDLIYFDATRAMPTPSYHVQAMFGRNRPGRILPMQVEGNTGSTPTGGRVGVGTWATQAEFKDVVVRKGDQVLYNSAETGEKGWKYESGKWAVADGVLAQSAGDEPAVALVGDPAWKDYTLSLKARKTGGNEGFLIPEAAGGDEKDGGTSGVVATPSTPLEIAGINTPHVPGRIETGRWYDVRAEVFRHGRALFSGQRGGPSCEAARTAADPHRRGDQPGPSRDHRARLEPRRCGGGELVVATPGLERRWPRDRFGAHLRQPERCQHPGRAWGRRGLARGTPGGEGHRALRPAGPGRTRSCGFRQGAETSTRIRQTIRI
ncbi:MAG: alpha-L-arabinofuranosidase C-terminal domain-containing protein [Kiritimatiellia bacterium]